MAKTDKPLSTPSTHRRSPSAMLVEADKKGGNGLRPDTQVSNTKPKIERIEDIDVSFEDVQPTDINPVPYDQATSVRPSPQTAMPQALPQNSPDIENLKKANLELSKQLDDLKQLVLLPSIKAEYEGKLFKEGNIFYIILKIFRFDEISCRRIGEDLYDIERKKIPNWEQVQLVSADNVEFIEVLAALQRDIEKTLAKLV